MQTETVRRGPRWIGANVSESKADKDMAEENSILGSLSSHVARLPLVNKLARQALHKGVSIFMFHRVLPKGAECYEPELTTSKEVFGHLLDWLLENFKILPLDELVKRRNKPSSDSKPLSAITFDDGWLDNYLHAFGLLRERKLPATIFLPVRLIGTARRFWQDRLWLCTKGLQPSERLFLIESAARQFPWFPGTKDIRSHQRSLKSFLMTRPSQEAEEFVQCLCESVGLSEASTDRAFLDWNEVRAMHNSGISFGSHTLNHSLLTVIPPAQLLPEICDSKRELQERLGTDVSSFSYPWGAASPLARQIAKDSGYAFAVGTTPGGLVREQDDDWMLPRLAVSDSMATRGGRFDSNKATVAFAGQVYSASRRRSARSYRSDPSKIKILFVIDQISNWEGGTERQLRTLIKSLDRKYFDPELRFIFRDPEFAEDTLPCKAQWICPDPKDTPSLIGRVFRVAQNLRHSRPAVVQGFFVEGLALGITAARLAGVPVIVGSKRNAGYWERFHHRLVFRSIAKLAHRWQCNSQTMWDYEHTVDKVSSNRLELLPNAIDLAHFKPVTDAERSAARKRLGLSENGPVFVLVAALTPVKNIATLVKAVSQIRPKLPNAQVVIVGDGPLLRDLQRLSLELDLRNTIHFVGRQKDVRPYLAAANFGVLTSMSEGSSNSVLEYMSMGLPSVVSDIRPNRELVSGLLFEPGNENALAEKLLAISGDRALQARLRYEYMKTAEQFSLERFAIRVQSYYSKLVAGVS